MQAGKTIQPERTPTLLSGGRSYRVSDLRAAVGEDLQRLPWVLRILLENIVRRGGDEAPSGIAAIREWLATGTSEKEIAFLPGRVLMHDTTCVPALVDIAAMRSAVAESGGDPTRLNPVLPVDVSVDHSVAVDHFAIPDALTRNMRQEYVRNSERYRLLKWASQSLDRVRISPPGTGIMHTINLERLATVVTTETRDGDAWAVPDTLIGTDSHTPMINGLGVLAWGVGGLEAESVLFGMPVMLRLPDVVGVKLTGRLGEGATATDLVLTVTERLRRIDLAGRFVEFFGPGVSTLSVGERAVVANMAPEYGASTGYFAVDEQALRYLRATGRSAEQAQLVGDYARHQSLWFDPAAEPRYTETLTLDLDRIGMSLAGPRRPQDRLSPDTVAQSIGPAAAGTEIPHGAVAVAAITSCTNTTDPRLLVTAGLLARKARQRGLKPPAWVKTSLAPGSPASSLYLERAGLLDDLHAVGFDIVGHGCTTCIGNSGPLTPPAVRALAAKTTAVAVVSGNRNFPGRIHPDIEMAFLASPPLVIAYALAGDVNRDILKDPLGTASDGTAIRLLDLWPSGAEIDAALTAVEAGDFAPAYRDAEASEAWRALEAPTGPLFPWDERSTYIRRPPFAAPGLPTLLGHYRAHPILVLGDDITTDHISPAGQIPAASDAGKHLIAQGDDANDLNVYAARRGNWEAMLRGLFTNRTVKNLLDAALPPGHTVFAPSGEVLPVWIAAERYQAANKPVVIVAGDRYGMGSSRDWAAKGVSLLGVRAVLATSFERIHRSNLIGMGILPLRLPADSHPQHFGLLPGDEIEIDAGPENLRPRGDVPLILHRRGGERVTLTGRAEVETSLELSLLHSGGIIPFIVRLAGAPS